MGTHPATLAVRPCGALDARLRVPGSKSLTNRALVAAALADGESRLDGALESDDTRVMREALSALGAPTEIAGDVWRVTGTGGRLRAPREPLWVGNSGTTARFLTAVAALAPGPVVLDGTPRMRERPIDDLTRALVALGARVEVLGKRGCPPVRVAGGGLPGGSAQIDASRSSQYVSAILLAAPGAREDVKLHLKDGVLVSRPYVDLTLALMRRFGAEAGWDAGDLHVRAARPYRAQDYPVEPDASSAAYPLCAAAIAGGRVRVEGLPGPGESLQADFGLLELLARMGCDVDWKPGHAEVHRAAERPLCGIDADCNALPDAVLALAVVALFASGPSHLRNVANLRIKETDRLAALERELRKLGAHAEAQGDGLHIRPGPLRGAQIDTYDDHRMAMAFSLAGLRVPGVVIRDPGCVSKTWPGWFEALERLCGR